MAYVRIPAIWMPKVDANAKSAVGDLQHFKATIYEE
jgi:hypothetical protein